MTDAPAQARMAQLPLALRPRERLIHQGASALTDVELLAILLRTGTRGRGVLEMAGEVLSRFGGLAGLLAADARQLAQVKGLGGNAKRAEVLAVMELARRALGQQLAAREVFQTPQAVAQYLQAHLAHLPYEVFAVLFLDAQHRLIAKEDLFRGTLTQTSVYPREVVTRALHHHASAVVLAHNHPSGVAEPSRADEALTHSLKAALALIDVRVLDHLIVARGASVSMAERGLI